MRFIQALIPPPKVFIYTPIQITVHTHTHTDTHTEYLVVLTRLFTVEFNSSVIKAFTSLKYTINGQNKGQLSAPWEP